MASTPTRAPAEECMRNFYIVGLIRASWLVRLLWVGHPGGRVGQKPPACDRDLARWHHSESNGVTSRALFAAMACVESRLSNAAPNMLDIDLNLSHSITTSCPPPISTSSSTCLQLPRSTTHLGLLACALSLLLPVVQDALAIPMSRHDADKSNSTHEEYINSAPV